jgi:hypothetical protein
MVVHKFASSAGSPNLVVMPAISGTPALGGRPSADRIPSQREAGGRDDEEE